MIAVIADDFTGAAEIGGIGLKYGLKVIIETEVNGVTDAELLIIATDTRSMIASEASLEIEKITQKLLQLKPEYIYKKLDSVLRGNIAAELVAQIKASRKKRAVIVAGNPVFDRLIEKGIYTIKGIPISETHFSNDPDFPIRTSSVVSIIDSGICSVESKKVDEVHSAEGLVIGDVKNLEDMQNWASKIDETTIAAGGAGFFDVILNSGHNEIKDLKKETVLPNNRSLFVFGSAFPKSNGILKRLDNSSVIKKNMPEDVYCRSDYEQSTFDQWVDDVVDCLNKNLKTIVSVDFEFNNEEGLAVRIKNTIAELVKNVMQRVQLDSLFIEGGATTSEILNSLKIEKLYPFKELDLGIIQMKVDEYPNLCITTKPGSYSWPKNINFENAEVNLI